MKKVKILLSCLILSALLLPIVSCTVDGNDPSKTDNSSNTAGTSETPDPEFKKIKLADKKKTYYPLIRPDVNDTDIVNLLSGTAGRLKDISGNRYEVGNDWVQEGTDTSAMTEMLLGNTARAESKEVMASLNNDGFAVKVVGNKVVIAAHTREKLAEAVLYMLDNLLAVEEEDGGNVLYLTGEYVSEGSEKPFFGADNPLSGYKIVCDTASAELKAAADALAGSLKKSLGVDLPVVGDSTEGGCEIVIDDGKKYSSLGKDEYTVVADGKKLLIACGRNEMTTAVVNSFAQRYISPLYSDRPLVAYDVNIRESLVAYADGYDFADSTDRAEGTDARVMSFNILCELWDEKVPVSGRDLTVTAVIHRYAPDVIGLQEVSDKWYAAFDNLFFGKYEFTDRKNPDGKTNFSTLAYNKETVTLKEHGVVNYSVGNSRQLRLVTWGLFEKKDTGKQFIVMSTHWDLTKNPQWQKVHSDEMAALALRLKEQYKVPVITTGDYNVREEDEYIKNFVSKTGFSEAKFAAKVINRAGTSSHAIGKPRGTGAQSIDHIFGSQDAEFLYFNTLVDQSILNASDHLPIYADIRFKN